MEIRRDLVISTPVGDATELGELATQLQAEQGPVESRALDGATVLTVVIPVVLGTLPIVRSWLIRRAEQYKHCEVIIRGQKFRGYSAADVTKILSVLQRELEGKKDDDSTES